MNELIEFIKENKIGKYLEEISLKMFNTYKVSAKARLVCYPKDIKCLKLLMKKIKEKKLKYFVLGNGSNVIFNFDYYDGVIIKLDYFKNLEVNGTIVTVGAGYPLPKLALKLANLGLSGLEFAHGIPGVIGASIAMNAGAYKKDIGFIVTKIKVLTPDFEEKTIFKKDLKFAYRTSFIKENQDYICLEATLKLERKDKKEILSLMDERKEKRLATQPLDYPSAGSVFRNLDNLFAGKLIEDACLKGKCINGATVSEKHANFIINKGNAKGKDIIELIELIKKKVYDKYGVELVLEQEII